MNKEGVIILYFCESPGGVFAVTSHLIYMKVTVKALWLWKKIFAHGKIKSRRKSLGKKKKEKKTSPKKKERVPFCQEKKKTSFVIETGTGGALHWHPDFKQRRCC